MNSAKHLKSLKAMDTSLFKKVHELLEKHYPEAKTALNYNNALEILVATILSAQCTDVRVNKVTPALFKRFRSPADYAKADVKEIDEYIKSVNFHFNKAKNIQAAGKLMVEKFDGKVPGTMDDLLELPGVARKTANVVLYNAFGIVVGVVVDTHVRRLSLRLGFTKNEKPEKIECDLMELAPKETWGKLSNLLIDHGRAICKAQRPLCEDCFLSKICPSAFKFNAKGQWVGPS